MPHTVSFFGGTTRLPSLPESQKTPRFPLSQGEKKRLDSSHTDSFICIPRSSDAFRNLALVFCPLLGDQSLTWSRAARVALGLVMVVGVGIGAILAASPSLFFIIRLLGCAYLVWLGISLLRAKGHAVIIEEHEAAPERTGWQLFRQGFLVNITNPKGLVFFISLLTPFINTDAPILLQYFEMGLTCGFTDFCVMTGVSLAAAAVASRMKGARNVTRMNRVFGTVFVLIGCGLFFFNL